jgi:3-hydroxybutyryl-CoA dehydratase
VNGSGNFGTILHCRGAGDTLTTTWTIVEKHHKPRHKGGIAVLSGVCRNQDGEVVVEADGKILVKSREKQ